MVRYALWMIGWMAASAAVAQTSSGSAATPAERLGEAEQLIAAGQVDEGLDLLRGVVSDRALDEASAAQAQFRIGDVLLSREDAKAEEELVRAFTDFPNYGDPANAYGVGLPTGVNRNRFGFRTKTTRKNGGNSLVTFDGEYEFFYNYGGTQKLYYWPRLVKQRDGRGVATVVTYDYEDGGVDQNGDQMYGEVSNQLRSKIGPTISLGPSGTRTPKVEYAYYPSSRLLSSLKTYDTAGTYREIAYEYDGLGRLWKEKVDPGGKNLITEHQYVQTPSAREHTVIDPDGYHTKTIFDTDGRVWKVQRFLNPGSASGNYYQTENSYDIYGHLYDQIVENKDQDGVSLIPAMITTRFIRDPIGRLMYRWVNPGSGMQETNFTYNWQDDILRQYDTSGRGVEQEYDGRGLLATETVLVPGQEGPELDTNLVTRYQYYPVDAGDPASGYLKYVTGPTGAKTQKEYDAFGRVWLERRIPVPGSGAETIYTYYSYDAAGHVIETLVDNGATMLSNTTARYDEGGFNYESRQRVYDLGEDSDEDPLIQRKFDWAGNVIEERSLLNIEPGAGDSVVTTHYDRAGRMDYTDDSEGGHTDFTRDGRGNVTEQKVTLQLSPSPAYAYTNTDYDALGRPVKITDPADENGLRHYRERKYDSRGNLLRETAFSAAGVPLKTAR